jgi:lysophospholipase L1-like esterase
VPHVVLLGDSVFDNRAYVAGGPDVVSHLHNKMPGGWQATLLGIDGATCSSVARQLRGLPPSATHLLVSAGGNDALGRSDILDASARSVADSLVKLSTIAGEFQTEYTSMLDALRKTGLPVAVCTIYDPRFPEPLRRELGRTALAVINDVVLREASVRGLPILDLRLVCDEDADFANPIEPSVQGGAKIAAAIIGLVANHDFRRRRTEVFVR